MPRITFTLGDTPPARLDKALARDVPEEAALSRTRLARLIEEGAVRVDGAVMGDAKAKVAAGAEITIDVPEAQDYAVVAQDIPLVIVHEDEDVLVVDKPAGLVVHPAPGTPSGTLVNALLHHFDGNLSGVGGEKRPGVVHRIDKDTSGLLVVAKSDRAHHGLAKQFQDHSVDRAYLALCYGAPDVGDPRLRGIKGVSVEAGGTVLIQTGLARHRTERQRQAVTFEGGRHAITRVRVLEALGTPAALALVECRLQTGRTHQIRVHMTHIGHGLVGDPTYGGRRALGRAIPEEARAMIGAFPRQALHAARLGFVHPVSGETLTFESAVPEDMARLLDVLR